MREKILPIGPLVITNFRVTVGHNIALTVPPPDVTALPPPLVTHESLINASSDSNSLSHAHFIEVISPGLLADANVQ